MKKHVSLPDIKFAQVLFLKFKQDIVQNATNSYILLSVCVCVVSYEVFYQQAIEGLVS